MCFYERFDCSSEENPDEWSACTLQACRSNRARGCSSGYLSGRPSGVEWTHPHLGERLSLAMTSRVHNYKPRPRWSTRLLPCAWFQSTHSPPTFSQRQLCWQNGKASTAKRRTCPMLERNGNDYRRVDVSRRPSFIDALHERIQRSDRRISERDRFVGVATRHRHFILHVTPMSKHDNRRDGRTSIWNGFQQVEKRRRKEDVTANVADMHTVE